MRQGVAHPLQDLQRIFASLLRLPESGDSTHWVRFSANEYSCWKLLGFKARLSESHVRGLANALRFGHRVSNFTNFATDTVIVQSCAGHFFATVEVTAIENNWIVQQLPQPGQVQRCKFFPFCEYEQRVGAF